jgi:hypothetical protein
MAEFGGESSPLWKVVQNLMGKWFRVPGEPVPVPIGLGKRPRGVKKKVGTPLRPPMQVVIVPGVEGDAELRALLLSNLKANYANQPHHQKSLDLIPMGSSQVVTPHFTERGHVVPPSIVPSDEHATRLRLLLLMLHCDEDAKTIVEAQSANNPGYSWRPDVEKPDFVEVLAALLQNVSDCVVPIYACGGWTKHPRCWEAMQRLARERRLIFLL